MSVPESQQESLVRHLQNARDAVLWKLDGVSDYDARRPLTPTGSNLLGIVKHLAYVELGYFVTTFGRELPVPDLFAIPDVDPHADLFATAEESRADIIDLYHVAWRESARTFEEHTLDATVVVPWWPEERGEVTLGYLLIHLVAETSRHAGHLDILRETVDGAAGLRDGGSNLPPDYDWPAYVARVEAVARTFRSTDHRDAVRGELIAEEDAVPDTIVVAGDEVSGDEAAVAVEFERTDGTPRRSVVAVTRHEGEWRASGGWSSSPRQPEPDAVFANHGGVGNERREVRGGWVADPSALALRLVDVRSDEVLVERPVRDGVVIVITDRGVSLQHARADLIGADGEVLRSQLLRASRRA